MWTRSYLLASGQPRNDIMRWPTPCCGSWCILMGSMVCTTWMFFLIFGNPNSLQCDASLQRAMARCAALGVPVAPGKTEGPST